ncbi:MAG: hypothetical protein H8D94_00035 [Candidatus Pelagibacter sp.]|nr:hypothetical protein [Candidatus Pelagibacter sp.]
MSKSFDEILDILNKLTEDEKELLIDDVQQEMKRIEIDIENMNGSINRLNDDVIELSNFLTQEEMIIFNENKHITGMT